ncbi:hypothetical protein GCK72_019775 [Caenorhabditis remanei]|uniref:Uncharacterized protein n=1 Tax=Caenorhabditis remanei TaxID=31234 RepID=A0A6A5GFM8_CAERE|nr:hypothetical protein GCK72_019775 [Caenorhabditis remanei]KAF1753219.1 hypothetical protein GCK72_019775 [Caenorhabditis remanei]
MKRLLLALLFFGVFHHLSAAILRNETYGTTRVAKDPRFYRSRTFKTATPENGTGTHNTGSYKIPYAPYNDRLFRNNTVNNGSRINQNETTRTPKYPRFNRTTMSYDIRHNQTVRGWSYPPFYRTIYANVSGNYTTRNGTYENSYKINSNSTTRNYHRAHNNTPKWTPMYPRYNRTIFMRESWTYTNATTRRSRFTPFYNSSRRNISEFEYDTKIRNHSGIHQNLTSRNQSYPRFYRTTVRYDHRHNQTTRGRSYPSWNRTSPVNASDTGNYTVRNGTHGNNSRIFEKIDSLPPYGDRLNSNATTRNYYRIYNNTPKWTPMYPRFNRTIFMNDSKNHNKATTRRWRFTPLYNNNRRNISEFENDTSIRNHSGIHQNLASRNHSYPRFYRTTVRYDHRHNQTTRGRSYPSFNGTRPENVSDTGNYTIQKGIRGNNSKIFETIDYFPPYGDRLNSNTMTRNYYRTRNNTPKWTPMYPKFNRTIFMNDSKNHNNATTRRWRYTPFYHNTPKNASGNGNGTNGSDFKNYHRATHGHYLHKLYHNSTDRKVSKSRPTRASPHHKA